MSGFFGPPMVIIASSDSRPDVSELVELEVSSSSMSSGLVACSELRLLWRVCSEAGGLLCSAESSDTEQLDGSLLFASSAGKSLVLLAVSLRGRNRTCSVSSNERFIAISVLCRV